ncbi:MAG: hypothetical protein AAFP19_19675 [Bacteroidota bacterium]
MNNASPVGLTPRQSGVSPTVAGSQSDSSGKPLNVNSGGLSPKAARSKELLPQQLTEILLSVKLDELSREAQ